MSGDFVEVQIVEIPVIDADDNNEEVFLPVEKQEVTKIKKAKKVKKPFVQRIWVRILTSFITLIALVIGALYGAMAVISWGPSPTARDLLINTLMETSAAKFVANFYFSDEEIAQMRKVETVVQEEIKTDPDLIQISEDVQTLVVEDIVKNSFKGKMMIISDPSRVFVGPSNRAYSSEIPGKQVVEIIENYGGVGGTNAGGFSDPSGLGNGGLPEGIVISQGELLWGNLNTFYEVIGIDKENKLIFGTMTAQDALDKNIRDAVSFGPVLISNGEVMEVANSGLNPRTAIGQRADGAILLLVCDGRQPNSIGASLSDIVEVMIEYEAVNAANLDGGSSTVMYQEGELINVCASLYGPRDMPTAIVVGPEVSGGESSDE